MIEALANRLGRTRGLSPELAGQLRLLDDCLARLEFIVRFHGDAAAARVDDLPPRNDGTEEDGAAWLDWMHLEADLDPDRRLHYGRTSAAAPLFPTTDIATGSALWRPDSNGVERDSASTGTRVRARRLRLWARRR